MYAVGVYFPAVWVALRTDVSPLFWRCDESDDVVAVFSQILFHQTSRVILLIFIGFTLFLLQCEHRMHVSYHYIAILTKRSWLSLRIECPEGQKRVLGQQ